MSSTPKTYFKKWLGLFINSFLLIIISIDYGESFLITNSQRIISLLSAKNVILNQNVCPYTNYLECSNRIKAINSTHQLNEDGIRENTNVVDSETRISNNILALLCSSSKQTEILSKLHDLISQNGSNLKRILYVTESQNRLSEMVNFFTESGHRNKVNTILQGLISFNDGSFTTIANGHAMQKCYSNWFNNNINLYEENDLKLNGEDVTESNREQFKECLMSLMNSYFMKDEELASLEYTKNPEITLDKQLLISTKRWIDNNYVETENIVERMKRVENKENVIVFDNFGYELRRNDDALMYKFSDQTVAALKPNTVFIGTTNSIYNTQHVTSWLYTLFGNVTTVTMSKSPKFKLLTRYGDLDVFTESQETYAKKYNKLEEIETKELWRYFTKKSNLVKLTNVNPELNKVIARAIKDSLSYLGIGTYHRLIRASTKVRDMFKPYIRELRKTEDFSKAEDKVDYLLNYIVDVSKNKTLAGFIESLHLNDVIKQQQCPGVHGLLSYIKKENLYPAVVYKLNDNLPKLMYKFYEYFKEKESGFDDSEEYKNLVKRNTDKLKVVVSNTKVPSASHYIFLDSYVKTKYGNNMMSNATLYTLTQGGRLVTFTMDMEYMVHNIRALVSPLYINLNKMKLLGNEHNEITELLSKRLFGSYLGDCKKAYKERSPDIFEMMDLKNKLENQLRSKNIDTTRLKELERRINRSKTALGSVRNTLITRYNFRSHLIETIMRTVPMRGSIVLGMDYKEYKLLDVGEDPFKCLSFKEEPPDAALSEPSDMMKKTIKNLKNKTGSCVLLQDVESGDKIITEMSFILDIVKLEDPEKVENDINVEHMPIEVNNIYSYEIKPENDYNDYFSVQDISVNCISLNKEIEIERPKLSSVLTGEIKDKIKNKVNEYERSVKEMEKLLSRAMEKEEIEEDKGEKKLNDLENKCEEYVKLEKKLKNVDLEQIMREHRFKRTFFGI
ncbi:conserved hypothetical protein [Theileria orientalis strain Shintoku]|uniref:Uncharacterized protein n=1 Tax=Theileria orientalis strain Shintoku TaxID=869250 RepID=J4C2L7_THEOR|nr:conserved hypothetical protein [Theileria orientalis strain Shintoku]BAM38911.1 conserved hypothetical protein [Theileria orientalis strain Shintoku]|eukprot:XP_009689212.1 conserved hypothetical protein [Theileria orientalis strain Shintoku]